MKIKEQKIILHFLRDLEKKLLENTHQDLNPFFSNFFTKDELIEILEHAYFDQDLEEYEIESLDTNQLLELIGSNYFILTYCIQKLESAITAVPTMTQSKVDDFFKRTQNEIHYLASKPVEEWDAYDVSNYRRLLAKTGTTKRVYAIFTSDVLADDVYAVTTKPSYFFDTKEEAEAELLNIVDEGRFTKDELVIHSLWRLT